MDAPIILRGAVGGDIAIMGRRIAAIGRVSKGALTLDLSGHRILPGLINAHDHLEFNLYSRMGNGPYPNAGAWARDVYRPNDSPIQEQLQIPKGIRLIWGGLKNLISGVTTVCHHNPRELTVFDRNFPVRVVKRFGWAHSLEFTPHVAKIFRATPEGWPFIVHLGEGRDRVTRREIFELDKLGALDSRTVMVHAIGLDRAGLKLAKERGASIVWCPSSNLFLFGRTLSDGVLSSGIPIALGSDSALTGDGDLLDEIRVARKASGVSSAAIYRMVTTDAARILRLPGGDIKVGGLADLIAIPETRRFPASPALVIVGGKVKLIAPSLARRMPKNGLHTLQVDGRGEFLVDANIPKLRAHVRGALGPDVRLAGRRIA